MISRRCEHMWIRRPDDEGEPGVADRAITAILRQIAWLGLTRA